MMMITPIVTFDIWLEQNYEHSGGEYYLSKNPNDYLMYEWHTLKEQWEKENYIQEELSILSSNYFLIVTETESGDIIYTRKLKGDDLLDCDSYLPEIEYETYLFLDAKSIAAGMGQYNIRIGFSPGDCHVWESKDYFLSNLHY